MGETPPRGLQPVDESGACCHSVTNYECYKGLYSSFNSMNLFEIGHSLARQFGPEPWTLYKGKHLLSLPGQPRRGTHRQHPAPDPDHLPPGLRPPVRHARRPCGVLRQRVGHSGAKGRTETPPCARRWRSRRWNDLTELDCRAWRRPARHSPALCYGAYRTVHAHQPADHLRAGRGRTSGSWWL